MSKKKETVTLRDALNKICYPTVEEASVAFKVFEHWIRTKTEPIWARDFAALARAEWPMEFYNYGWPVDILLKELLGGYIYEYTGSLHNGWLINIPDPILISEEKDREEIADEG